MGPASARRLACRPASAPGAALTSTPQTRPARKGPALSNSHGRLPTLRATAGGEPTAPDRVAWADVAKGLCILLVVLHHVTSKHLPSVLPDSLVLAAWQGLDQALKPVRMPLFFVISGTFAASAIRRPWRAVLGPRVVSSYWLYVVWLSLQAPLFLFVATRIATHRVNGVGEWLLNLVLAGTGLWYLYGLAVYFVAAKALTRLPHTPVLAAAAALSAAASLVPTHGVNRASLLQCFVYFLVGAYAPALVAQIRRTGAVGVLGGVAGGGLLAAVLGWAGAPRSLLLLAVSPAVVWVGIQVSMALERRRPTGPALATLGRRTLPVYVLHMPLIGLGHEAAVALGDLPTGPVGVGVALLYPPALTAAVVLACLLLQRCAERYGAPWLFRAPAALTRVRRPTGS